VVVLDPVVRILLGVVDRSGNQLIRTSDGWRPSDKPGAKLLSTDRIVQHNLDTNPDDSLISVLCQISWTEQRGLLSAGSGTNQQPAPPHCKSPRGAIVLIARDASTVSAQ
jgi:hypothetical protein